ncbi:Hypothetical protein, conserved [Brucella canis ATCC 23365]|uniref:Uncharacterized protein n=2 Tax=Brucella TaxID=234 RepID=A9MBH1_BRUC2|nr:Hypothetical protein, conserved [Brucella canis ATCC 23365]EEH13856.1 Hypothetical protein, conserved [Brucella ceti str. Cudo]
MQEKPGLAPGFSLSFYRLAMGLTGTIRPGGQ